MIARILSEIKVKLRMSLKELRTCSKLGFIFHYDRNIDVPISFNKMLKLNFELMKHVEIMKK